MHIPNTICKYNAPQMNNLQTLRKIPYFSLNLLYKIKAAMYLVNIKWVKVLSNGKSNFKLGLPPIRKYKL